MVCIQEGTLLDEVARRQQQQNPLTKAEILHIFLQVSTNSTRQHSVHSCLLFAPNNVVLMIEANFLLQPAAANILCIVVVKILAAHPMATNKLADKPLTACNGVPDMLWSASAA